MPLLLVKNKRNKLSCIKNLKHYGSFLWMGFNCFKAIKPLQGDILFFTTESPRVPGTHLIDFDGMRG